jgi:Carboxypeptidase regulatory-like domain
VERAQMAIRKKLFLVTVAIMTTVLPSVARTDRATLEGTVTDPSAATISGARVKITAVETGLMQERTTNSNGQYRFPGIAIGLYTVSVSNSSFKTKVIEDVVLQVGQARTLDVSLQIGEASEKVDVVADRGPAERSSAEAATVTLLHSFGKERSSTPFLSWAYALFVENWGCGGWAHSERFPPAPLRVFFMAGRSSFWKVRFFWLRFSLCLAFML